MKCPDDECLIVVVARCATATVSLVSEGTGQHLLCLFFNSHNIKVCEKTFFEHSCDAETTNKPCELLT